MNKKQRSKKKVLAVSSRGALHTWLTYKPKEKRSSLPKRGCASSFNQLRKRGKVFTFKMEVRSHPFERHILRDKFKHDSFTHSLRLHLIITLEVEFEFSWKAVWRFMIGHPLWCQDGKIGCGIWELFQHQLTHLPVLSKRPEPRRISAGFS